MKNVILWTGAGQIGMAIARRVGVGKKLIVGDKKIENAQKIVTILNQVGFDVESIQMDLSSRESILNMISCAQKYGEIANLINAAGVSLSQASIETILQGTAVLLEEVGKVIKEGETRITVSRQSGRRMPALTYEQDAQLALTSTKELLNLSFLQQKYICEILHTYQLAKRCNVKRVMSEASKWGTRGACINSVSSNFFSLD